MSNPTLTLSTADLTPENAPIVDAILANSHPLMVEAFYLAAIPQWYNARLLKALRDREDGREQGLITRLERYSFISALRQQAEAEPAYFVRPEERRLLQQRWIAEDPQAYKMAHQRALAFWQTHPDPNPFAQAQSCLYHQFFVDYDESVRDLIALFRTYSHDHQFAAIERLLKAAEQAHSYLVLMDAELSAGFEDLLHYLKVRLAQVRGQWTKSLELLEELAASSTPSLAPYVARAYGYAWAQAGNYVEAIEKFKQALALFAPQDNAFVDAQSGQSDHAYTLIALADAYVGLARSVRGGIDQAQTLSHPQQYLRNFLVFIMSLPLVLYLTPSLGWRVWHPRFWPVLRDLDWIIARLFVTGAKYYREADHLLEQYGTTAESVVADERLAYLYLALGDVEQAEQLFLHLLAEVEAPLRAYHQASVCVGLGETYLRLRQPRYALKPLYTALPILARYEDRALEARARDLLGRALLATEEPTEAIQNLSASESWYQAAEKWTEATRLVEHLETWSPARPFGDFIQMRMQAIIDSLQTRQYVGIFQHQLPVYFRRLVVMFFPIVLIVAQLLTSTIETGSGLAPEIRFRPAPLLDPEQVITTDLSLSIQAAHVVLLEQAEVVVTWAIMFIVGYLLLSLLLGLAIILFTKLRTVQVRGRGATVHFDNDVITVGMGDVARTLRWADIGQFIKADVRLWSQPTRNSSAFGLAIPQDQLVIGGDTSHYAHIREQAAQLVAPLTQIINLDYAVLRSKMGALFMLTLLLIGAFDLVADFAQHVVFQTILGTIYTWADLYPYVFLGLVIPWLWWGIIQPLRQRLRLRPREHLALGVFGIGMLLTLIQIVLRFRPLMTVPNIYPPLVTLVVMVSAGVAIWRAQVAGQKVYPPYARVGAGLMVLGVCGLMLTVLQRDVQAYHHLVAGHTLRDQALRDDIPNRKTFLMRSSIDAYARAEEIGSHKVWGMDTKAAAKVPVGIPAPDEFIWLAALSNQAALQVQLGDYAEAVQNYTAVLAYNQGSDRMYAWRALARLGAAAIPDEQNAIVIDRSQYEHALEDFDKAIQLNPDKAVYYLWRGVAQQSLGRLDEALGSYNGALKCEADNETGCLRDTQRERALTGQGWIQYMREDYKTALDLFWQAKKANPASAEAWVGEGYALYTLGLYEDVLTVWEKAAELDPQDPTILISLGTLHWKFGGESEELNRDRCEEYRQSIELFTEATERDKFYPQSDKEIAYTYRTRAQVLYLLQTFRCTDDRVATLQQAVASYSEAIRLDPQNAFYWQMRGRLSYSVWWLLDQQLGTTDPTIFTWALHGLDDIETALDIDPVDDPEHEYLPNAFRQGYFTLPMYKLALVALEQGDIAEAMSYYRRCLYPEAETVDTAMKFALMAMANDDIPEAAHWFNQATRFVLNDTNKYYFDWYKASRQHVKALWAFQGVKGAAILTEMEAQLPQQLEAYPELQSNGYYWRYRAWLKYYYGLAAFRLGTEADAETFLQSCQADAKRASDLSKDHIDRYTYFTEAAWGWYHVERGNDYAAAGNLSSALDDYEAAFATITPQLNSDAFVEKTQAAFSAGVTALKLEQFERASAWYNRGMKLVESYENNSDVQALVEPVLADLHKLLEENPDITSAVEPIVEALEALR